jgi:hypothetical protein
MGFINNDKFRIIIQKHIQTLIAFYVVDGNDLVRNLAENTLRAGEFAFYG